MSDLAPSPSRALRVTFFEDRAEVLRRAEVTVVPGAQWVAVAGVTPYVDDRSLTARALGEAARVLAARVRRRVHQDPAAGREEIERREAEARAAGQRLEAARREAARAQAREGRAAQLLAQWMAAMGAVPRFFADPARADEWTDAYRTLDDAVRAAHAAVAAARAALTRAGDEKRRADQRLTEGRVAQPRHETVVEVQLEARAGATVPVEIGYRTPCALWRPEHLARLADAKIELVTSAAAWQHTGEDWDGVAAVFSTARTARHATPPVVGDDVLRLRRRSDEDRKHVVVEARDQVVAAAGLDRGTRAVDEMPGVDDGGEPLAFAPAAKVSIPSDGRPLRVEVARASFPAEVALVLYPERAPVAHLRATATLAQGAPLLAGPVTLARGASLVGRARLDYVGAGEPFELGFGPDDAVRVRRTAADERDTTTFTGAQTIERTVKVYLSNLSGEARTVEVTERVPVSELAQVEVSFTPGPWKWEPKYGFARQVVELPAGATRTLTLSYQVKAPAKVSLPL